MYWPQMYAIAYAISTTMLGFARKADFVSLALSSKTETSTPMRAAGTNPNALKTLKRPPTLGSALTTV